MFFLLRRAAGTIFKRPEMQECVIGGIEAVEGKESAQWSNAVGVQNLVQKCDFRAQKEWKNDCNEQLFFKENPYLSRQSRTWPIFMALFLLGIKVANLSRH